MPCRLKGVAAYRVREQNFGIVENSLSRCFKGTFWLCDTHHGMFSEWKKAREREGLGYIGEEQVLENKGEGVKVAS